MTLEQRERAVSRLLGGRDVKSLFWLAYEGIHCAVLLAAVTLLFIYVFQLSPRARFASSWVLLGPAPPCNHMMHEASSSLCTCHALYAPYLLHA